MLQASWMNEKSGQKMTVVADWCYKTGEGRCTGIWRGLLAKIVNNKEVMDDLVKDVMIEQTLARSLDAMKYRGNELRRAKQFYVKERTGKRLYRYPGMSYESVALYKTIASSSVIDKLVKLIAGVTFGDRVLDANHVILTRYETAEDNIGRHSDKAKDITSNSLIVMLSFGDKREFVFDREDEKTGDVKRIVRAVLRQCDVVVLDTESNVELKHSVNSVADETLIKRVKPFSTRVSIVMRNIKTFITDAELEKKLVSCRRAKAARARAKERRKAEKEAAAEQTDSGSAVEGGVKRHVEEEEDQEDETVKRVRV